MTGTNWAEEEERRSFEDEHNLPPPVVEFDKDRQIKRETCYRIQDRDLVKEVREYKWETQKISHAQAVRKHWKKFGSCMNDPVGPNPANTYPGEEVFMKFVNDKELNELQEEEDQMNKLKGKDQTLKCRTCGGGHFSHKCPYKDELFALKEWTNKLGGSHAEGGDASIAPKPNNNIEIETPRPSGRPGAYVPPGMRGKIGGGESSAPSNRNEGHTLRVSNLPEDTRDADLTELFSPFGRVQRIYLAKDKITNLSKGFAFVTYYNREDAARALAGVNGFGYDHLILTVEWAKPSTNN